MTPTREPIDLEPIKARDAAATPGPWELDHNATFVRANKEHHGDWDWIVGDMTENSDLEESDLRGHNIQANCTFIAHARQDIPALIEEVERLRGETAFHTATVECLGVNFQMRAYKKFFELAKDPQKTADHYFKDVVFEAVEKIFKVRKIQEENHALHVALNHYAEPGNLAHQTLMTIRGGATGEKGKEG